MNTYQIKNDIKREIEMWKETFKRLNRKFRTFMLNMGFYSYRIRRVK